MTTVYFLHFLAAARSYASNNNGRFFLRISFFLSFHVISFHEAADKLKNKLVAVKYT